MNLLSYLGSNRRQQSPAILNTTSIFSNEAPVEPPIDDPSNVHGDHPWGIFFTVLGTVLLDFDADACQSPSRAYLLDVTVAGRNNKPLPHHGRQGFEIRPSLISSINSVCFFDVLPAIGCNQFSFCP